ncbi:MAG TPA: ABC transporter permease [Acidimicrobiales bacterium]|nr:ABC transporter permease [Acidimicrobiales bacterium]
MLSLGYVWNELHRRSGRTIVTALGLAAGVGLVMAISGVSDGLSQAQNRVLSPLGSVGTDIIVTRTVAPTTSTASSSTSNGNQGSQGSGSQGGGAGPDRGSGGFFATGPGGPNGRLSQLNSADTNALLNANSSVLTDLSKLGPAGTKFVHDFFVPGTLITFPSQAVSVVSAIPHVTSAVGALTLQAVHESGTVPSVVATFQTGGQTINATTTPPPLTAAQRQATFDCLQKAGLIGSDSTSTGGGTSGSGGTGATGGSGGTGGTGFRRVGFNSDNPAFIACLPAAQQSYITKVVVPAQTIRQVLNPPSTDTSTSTYTVAGVDPTHPNTGVITKAQLVSGHWFDANAAKAANEVLVNNAYASTKKLTVGGTLTINGTNYNIVGLVSPTLTGNVSDIYFELPTMQNLSSSSQRVNEVLVSVHDSSQVSAVGAAIKKALPGAQVLTSKDLADQVTGSLANAHRLASDLGGALAIVVLLAAFAIAALLTLSNVAKRVREIGSLRAIGWSRGLVVRQLIAETLGIGVLGGVLGIGVGLVISAIIGAVGPGLTVTSSGLTVGASSVSSLIHQSTTGSISTIVHLTAPISMSSLLLGFAGALLGGLLAGIIGGWRAARLSPATALRDLG